MRSWAKIAERGSLLGMRIIACMLRLLGRRAARLLLRPIVAYFALIASDARHASHEYLQRVLNQRGEARQPSWSDSYWHMLNFAEAALDKFAAWHGSLTAREIDFPQHAAVQTLLSQQRGGLVIGSHLGNLEMMRALAGEMQGVVINAVVYSEHAQRFTEVMQEANPAYGVNLIHVTQIGPETAIMLKEKIDRGELLVIVGDRTPPHENGRTTAVKFLGADAPFAQGPIILAHLLECPVYLFFCLHENGRYRVYFENFAERVDLPRRAREAALRSYLQRYANRLQHYCLQAPYQWFNFYDFWGKKAPSEKLS